MVNSLSVLSEQKKKFLDKVHIITSDPNQEIGFVVRSMVIASMPHSKVKGIHFKRANNQYTLTITGNEEAGGIPYGVYPRLILCWIISEVTRTKSREITLGKSLSQFMKRLQLNITGGRWGTVTRFKEQLKMLFSAQITISYQSEDKNHWVSTHMNIADKTSIFWSPNVHNMIGLFDSKVVLGEEFFSEIISNPIPIDTRAIEALKESSLALDIYFWLTYRMSYLRQQTEIPFGKLHVQFGAGYDTTSHGHYEFKRKFLIQLQKVLLVYPEARVEVQSNGIVLQKSMTHVSKIKVLKLPFHQQ
jgi:hypothetical protein